MWGRVTLQHSAENSGEPGADAKLELSKGDYNYLRRGLCTVSELGPLSKQESTMPSTKEAFKSQSQQEGNLYTVPYT